MHVDPDPNDSMLQDAGAALSLRNRPHTADDKKVNEPSNCKHRGTSATTVCQVQTLILLARSLRLNAYLWHNMKQVQCVLQALRSELCVLYMSAKNACTNQTHIKPQSHGKTRPGKARGTCVWDVALLARQP